MTDHEKTIAGECGTSKVAKKRQVLPNVVSTVMQGIKTDIIRQTTCHVRAGS